MTNSNGWYVVYVRFRHEQKVYNQLLKKGIDSFLPMIFTMTQWSDRKKKVQKPLFPSYIFVNIKSIRDFYNVLSIDSACSYIRLGNEYGRVSQKEINQLRLLVGGKDITDVQTNLKLPSIGDKLRIEHGEFCGLECEVYRIKNIHKISVWINVLHLNISATIPSHYFQKCG